MKKINYDKLVYIKFCLTFVLLFVVILGIFAYLRNDNENTDYKVTVSTGTFSGLDVLSETDALAQTPTQVSITNEYEIDLDYKLYFIVDDKTTIDSSYIRVNYNGVTYNLAEMKCLTVDTKKYYYLCDGTSSAGEEEIYDAFVWIDSSFNGDRSNAKIYINFGTL